MLQLGDFSWLGRSFEDFQKNLDGNITYGQIDADASRILDHRPVTGLARLTYEQSLGNNPRGSFAIFRRHLSIDLKAQGSPPTVTYALITSDRKPQGGGYFMYGSVNITEGSVESVAWTRPSCCNSKVAMAALGYFGRQQSDARAFFQIGQGRNVVLSYSTLGHLFGLQGLTRLVRSNLRIGGEVYYTGQENSGGRKYSHHCYFKCLLPVSIGGHWTPMPLVHLTTTLNPMMGHLNISLASLGKSSDLATRFSYNLHSRQSNLQVGLDWRRNGDCLRASLGLVEGLAVEMQSGDYDHGISLRLGLQVSRSASNLGFEVSFLK